MIESCVASVGIGQILLIRLMYCSLIAQDVYQVLQCLKIGNGFFLRNRRKKLIPAEYEHLGPIKTCSTDKTHEYKSKVIDMKQRLIGKTAIVTGASRGLGRAIALAFVKEGACVALISRTSDDLHVVADEIGRIGGQHLIFSGDISREADVKELVDQTIARFNRVDVLINNAGVIGPARFIKDTDSDAWTKTIGINLNGAYLCCRAVIPYMLEQGGGRIINISSGLGHMAFPRFCAYAVSKAGIIQLTRSLAEEFKDRHILVNAISPGMMDTSMMEYMRSLSPETLTDSIARYYRETKDAGELGHPADVAPLAVFLASSDSGHLTGRNGSLNDYRRWGWN
jgi:NAD(P)-dependent dehydrogenase (short-subunit alcohol dehydrogenase family)